jgi:hypothetical protein
LKVDKKEVVVFVRDTVYNFSKEGQESCIYWQYRYRRKKMNRIWGHFKTITKHKILVTRDCFRIGLYKQGLLHDLSKYSPVEFLAGVKYYQGYRSPINQEKEEKGYSLGWLHHKGRNKHHFEYWIDYGANPQNGLIGVKMPKRYLCEMIAH